MRPLWLDYQRSDPDRRRPGVLLLGVSVLAASLLFGYYADLVDRVDLTRHELSRLKRTAERDLEQDLAAAAVARSGKATTAGRTAAQWESLFTALEAASGDRVTLLALRPGASEVVISGEAIDLEASADYIRRLQEAPVLTDVHLTSSAPVVDHPQRPLRFALLASWPDRELEPPRAQAQDPSQGQPQNQPLDQPREEERDRD